MYFLTFHHCCDKMAVVKKFYFVCFGKHTWCGAVRLTLCWVGFIFNPSLCSLILNVRHTDWCPDEPVCLRLQRVLTRLLLKVQAVIVGHKKRLQYTSADSADYVIVGDIKFYEWSRNVTLKWSIYTDNAVRNLQDVWIMDDMNMSFPWPRAPGYQ